MALALTWARHEPNPCSQQERDYMTAIEEAFAAYDPNCGARTAKQAGVTEALRHELYRDLCRCLDDVSTEFRARGRCDSRFTQLRARLSALAAIDAEGDGNADDRALWGVVANAGRLAADRKMRWAHVVDATGLGSTRSSEMCRRFGFDPDEMIGGTPPDPQEGR